MKITKMSFIPEGFYLQQEENIKYVIFYEVNCKKIKLSISDITVKKIKLKLTDNYDTTDLYTYINKKIMIENMESTKIYGEKKNYSFTEYIGHIDNVTLCYN